MLEWIYEKQSKLKWMIIIFSVKKKKVFFPLLLDVG